LSKIDILYPDNGAMVHYDLVFPVDCKARLLHHMVYGASDKTYNFAGQQFDKANQDEYVRTKTWLWVDPEVKL
jgi:hypothetical protein